MDDAFCYIGIKDGEPGAHSACVDNPEHKKDTAKFVAAELRKGHRIERVPVEQARTMLGEYLTWRIEQKKSNSTRSKTEELFAEDK